MNQSKITNRKLVPLRPRFWERFKLKALTLPEWEALCDGCGKCCLIKLENQQTKTVDYTNIACRLFDSKTCQCKHYSMRKKIINDCIALDAENIKRHAQWLPHSCAYRRLHNGQTLPSWHPLISNNPGSVHNSGISMREKTIPEYKIHPDMLHHYIVKGLQE